MPTIISRGAFSGKAFGLTGQTTSPVYVEDVFSTYLYTGNGSGGQTITNNIDLSTKGGMIWMKTRARTAGDVYSNNFIWDTVRGNGALKYLYTNTIGAEGSDGSYGGGVTFNTNGFITSVANNQNTETYASWTFRKQPKFFTISTWTGDGTDNRQIAHDLGSVPGMIIVKCTSQPSGWHIYHKSLGNNKVIRLDTASAADTDTIWNNTTPTSSVFTVNATGTGAAVNYNSYTYIAYLFADQAGGFGLSGSDSVVACGSFTGASFVSLGWEPQYILLKRSDSTGNWLIFDTMRGLTAGGGGNDAYLLSDTSSAEASGANLIDIGATGFTPTFFGSGTYIYLAIRRGPMKTPTDATKVFSPNTSSAALGTVITTGFPVDAQFLLDRPDAGTDKFVVDRLRGVNSVADTSTGWPYLTTTTTNAETTAQMSRAFSNTGFQIPYFTAGLSLVYHNFRRAPGFFDVVCYTGSTSAIAVTHGLGVAPEMIICKSRSGAYEWAVYHSGIGNTKYLQLQSTQAASSAVNVWSNTTPTSTSFTLNNVQGWANGVSGATYVAYLFATCPGVSKVGSYTGTGAAQNIDCGFSAGARFVLIKRTDSTGDWYVYDSARGISSGNDPYLLLNSTAAEVTGTNYVDTFASGFTLTASAPAGLNANGGSYIFLAIA